jgi:hypothetical protein
MRNPLERYYKSLGTLIVNFNLLEHDMAYALWALSGINEQHTADIMLGRIRSFDSLIHLFKQLANQRFKDKATRRRIKSLAKRLVAVNMRRNDLIHGKWVSFGSSANIIRFQDRKDEAKWRIVKATPTQIHASAIQVIRLQISFRRFITTIQKRNDQDRLATSRKKS